MEEVARRSTAARQSTMLLLSVFGTLALLAAAGSYGVMAHFGRTADARDRGSDDARRAAGRCPAVDSERRVTAGHVGLTLGLSGAVLLMRWLRSVLYQVSPADPVTLAGVGLLLITTSLLACYVPARRAMKVDPVTALRKA